MIGILLLVYSYSFLNQPFQTEICRFLSRLFGFLVITGAKGPINVGEESEENDTVLFLSHLVIT